MLEALAAGILCSAQLGWRAGTPEPILDANPRWVELYWKAWENLYAVTVEEKEPGPFPSRAFAPGNRISYDQTLAIALYARWGWRAHPVRETLSYVLEHINEAGFAASLFGSDGTMTGEATGPPLASLAALRLWQISANDLDLPLQMSAAQRRYAYLAGKYTFQIPKDGDKPERLGYRVPLEFSILPMPTEAPGEVSAEAAGLLLQEAQMLSELRAAGGDRRAAEVMSRIAGGLSTKLASVWQPDAHRFAARDDAGSMERDSLAPLIGLISGRLPEKIAQDALRGLFDPERFYRRTLFPVTARPDGAYIGSTNVRPLLSYLALRALIANRMMKDAARAAEHMLATYALAAGKGLSLYDFYGAETRVAPDGAEAGGLEAGTIAIAALIEAVIGIDVDARQDEVTWFLRRTDRHGIKNLRFANNVVTLISSERTADAMPTIDVHCDQPFTLKVTIGGKTQTRSFEPGTHTWTLAAEVE